MNYEHIQLDPKVNRVRIEKGSPADPARERRNIPQPAADPHPVPCGAGLQFCFCWFSHGVT